MERIAIIGASYLQVPLVLKARECGLETHVFAWEKGATAREYADFFYPISITEKDKILDVCKKLSPVAVASIASDLAVPTVNHVARALGLPCNPPCTDILATNKVAMRGAFARSGLVVPSYAPADCTSSLEDFGDFSYPLVVKSTDRSGSRGVTMIENPAGLAGAIRTAVEESFEKRAIVEEYIDGDEYSCESISYNGSHKVLALTKKFTTGAPHFIETAHLEPSDLSPKCVARVERQVNLALDALGIRFGASHAEFKVTPGGEIVFIEVGSRMGGDCIGSDLVHLSTGQDFVKMVIDVARGCRPSFSSSESKCYALCKFILNEADYLEYERTLVEAPNLLYRADIDKSTAMTGLVTDSSSRYGMYILRSSSRDELAKYIPRNRRECNTMRTSAE